MALPQSWPPPVPAVAPPPVPDAPLAPPAPAVAPELDWKSLPLHAPAPSASSTAIERTCKGGKRIVERIMTNSLQSKIAQYTAGLGDTPRGYAQVSRHVRPCCIKHPVGIVLLQ